MSMSVREAGRKGGIATAKKYGHEHYSKIGRKGGRTVKRLIEKGQQANHATENSKDS